MAIRPSLATVTRATHYSGHSNDRHNELSSCCRAQADDTGRKECIENFTTSQPSSAPSETTPAEDSIDEAGAEVRSSIGLF